MSEQHEIGSVTGVDLQLDIAGPGARAYGFVIDWHIRILLALSWYLVALLILSGGALFGEGANVSAGSLGLIGGTPALVIYFFYHPVLEWAMRGRTPGKRFAGVRIVTRDGQIPGALAILVRNVLRLLDSLPVGYMVGLVCTIMTRDSVRVGDMAAGTLLVYTGSEQADTTGLATQASVAAHGLENAELGTELLARWDQLAEDRRADMARRLIVRLGGSADVDHDEGLRAQLKILLHADSEA